MEMDPSLERDENEAIKPKSRHNLTAPLRKIANKSSKKQNKTKMGAKSGIRKGFISKKKGSSVSSQPEIYTYLKQLPVGNSQGSSGNLMSQDQWHCNSSVLPFKHLKNCILKRGLENKT